MGARIIERRELRMRPAGRQSLRVSRAPERRACLASDTRRKRNRRDPRPTPYMHEHSAQAVRSHTTRQTTPAQPASGARRSLVLFTDRRFSNCPYMWQAV